ncbi:long-chain fatty acid--CoA ligase [Nitriliruptor alkaliphilus]|uniref:long-chain fatty acid--CoA ligase n=1 Tax=Nitriliruptor alkaliphilus TaxID=427918 RepID=UPI000AA266A8|nr:long-chain fatty acid--CoA ligase [Nitriliruptor alkaliphilus]
MVHSTMQDYPLTVTQLFEHGRKVHGHHEVVTWRGDHSRRVTFAETYDRAGRLAAGLASLGIGDGDVVGTFCWNHQEHVEAYFAIPCMGAVLHQLNIRLFPDQLTFVVADLGDRVIIVDDSLIPLLARVLDELTTVEVFVVVGDGDASALDGHPARVVRYDDLLADADPGFRWPELAETAAAASCYTSGTTGNPKGVVYSHRSIWTHTLGAAAGGVGVGDGDKLLVIVPQFHANAWGLIHIGWAYGADLLLPAEHLQPEPLVAFIEAERPTCSAAVPTVWNGVLAHGEGHDIDLSSLDWVVVGGSAVPRSMISQFEARYGVTIIQGWGMTEMSPLGTVSTPPAGVTGEASIDYRAKTGRLVPGVDMRIVDPDGAEQPWDGEAMGEIQVRGPWITAGYHGVDTPEKFHDGWLRTGDVGVIEPNGFVQLVDRTKDVIKSGGEWISSVDLENALMGHPDVAECAVIAVADERWDERPLACVVRREGSEVTPEELNGYLEDKVARWWLPERYAFVAEVPKTSVGKFDKKVLRAAHEQGELEVTTA